MRCPALALAVLALTPAGAAATTRFVAPQGRDSGTCPRSAPCSVAYAINGTGSRAGDTVRLAAGAYIDQPVVVGHPLSLFGPEHRGRPVLQAHPGTGPVFTVEPGAADTTATRLAVRGASGAPPVELRAAASLSNFTITTPSGPCLVIFATGTRIDHSRLTQTRASSQPCLSSDQNDTGLTSVQVSAPHSPLAVLFSGDGTIDDATLRAHGTGLQLGGTPTVHRVTASGIVAGIALAGASALVTDTVAVARRGGTAVLATGGSDELLNVTAYASGAGSYAIHAVAGASLTVKSTIALGAGHDIVADPPRDAGEGQCAGPDPCAGSLATADHSIFRLGVGVVDRGENISAPPRFLDPAHGNFRLAHGSPAIDGGTFELQSGTADRAGLFRWLGRKPDIGAYESRPPAARPPGPPDRRAPVLTHVFLGQARFRVARRGVAFSAAAGIRTSTLVHFKVSEQADIVGLVAHDRPDAPDLGTFVRPVRSGYHRLKLSGRVDGRPLPPGRYVLTLIARDRAQNLSREARLPFTVVP